MRLFDRRLYLIFTPSLCTADPWQTLDAALGAGVDLVQWRCKEKDRAGFERVRETCRRFGVPLIVNDDVMLAVRGRAAGAHIGQEDMPADAARKVLVERCLGVSTHVPAQIANARAAGADYIGFGPCYPTTTKGYQVGKTPAEIEAAVAAAHLAKLPLFAIGGITVAQLPELRAQGIDRIAVCSAILQSEDPAKATSALRRWL
jgi:thiamine-phosphate pyrophosphorylase